MAGGFNHGGDIRRAAKAFGLDSGEILDFSANINPLGPPAGAIRAVLDNVPSVVHYPDPECYELKQALAAYYGVSPRMIMVGNGAAELIFLLGTLARGKKALIPAPTFSEYEAAVLAGGGTVEILPLDPAQGFELRADQVLRFIRPTRAYQGIKMVFLATPNNPTGGLIPKETLMKIAAVARGRGVTVVVDEAFLDFLPERAASSMMAHIADYPNLLVVTSLTKLFAVPGLRIGALVGPPEVLEGLEGARPPWTVNSLAQAAGCAAVADGEYLKASWRLIQEEKEWLHQALGEIEGLHAFPPAANFILVDISGSGFNSTQLWREMARQSVLVRDCASFRGLGRDYIRVAVRSRRENEVLVRTLRQTVEDNFPQAAGPGFLRRRGGLPDAVQKGGSRP
ncbi:MAG: threonine-phosphate decarboxylase CobD [Firmicutes bacterium]|nr:threonine-phosphate decarboxylase CobD [Bacillota bacterium]